MRGFHVRVGEDRVEPGEEWSVRWLDESGAIALVSDGRRTERVLVEGSATDWFVTLRGRRVPVTVRTRREKLLAEAEVAARAAGGPVDVKATLPGLIVAVRAREGDEVAEGDPLLTIEAMKMQNEVRAPRAGRVIRVAVTAGQPVPTGALLLTLA